MIPNNVRPHLAYGTYAEYEYDAYGNPIGANTHTVNPFGYTGQYTDYETGLVYLRNIYIT